MKLKKIALISASALMLASSGIGVVNANSQAQVVEAKAKKKRIKTYALAHNAAIYDKHAHKTKKVLKKGKHVRIHGKERNIKVAKDRWASFLYIGNGRYIKPYTLSKRTKSERKNNADLYKKYGDMAEKLIDGKYCFATKRKTIIYQGYGHDDKMRKYKTIPAGAVVKIKGTTDFSDTTEMFSDSFKKAKGKKGKKYLKSNHYSKADYYFSAFVNKEERSYYVKCADVKLIKNPNYHPFF